MSNFFYKAGDIIREQYQVQKILGQGAFSDVYKVLDLISGHTYALKVLKTETADIDVLRKEFNILKELYHPNIVRAHSVGQIPGQNYFLQLDFVLGEPLKELIRGGKLSFAKVREISLTLLDALQYLRGKSVMHMDIKPSNILMSEKGPVLIDFNISRADVTSTSTIAGTRSYQPPEIAIGLGKWRPESDLYSLGIVMFEMILGKYPFSNQHMKDTPPDPRDLPDCPVSNSLAELLLKAVAPDPKNRFQTPAEMIAAVEATDWTRQQAHITSRELFDAIFIFEDVKNKPNYNPYLTRLLTLYSQSTRTNVGTRGFDDLAQATYVETLLDRKLTDEILSGKHQLIIISGNAGDGKTAFIQKFESNLRDSPDTLQFTSYPNGASFLHKGIRYVTNYDGSQDEGKTDNDDVLLTFFRPFMGKTPASKQPLVHIIALNEGRLLDFLHHHSTEFSFLNSRLIEMFEQKARESDGLLLVNLNMRSVVLDNATGLSIFDHMIERFTSPELWERCGACNLKDRCYVKFNVDSIRDINYGQQIKDRLESLFRIAHFRHRLHITIRDLRSALSYLLFGSLDCDDIHALEADVTRRADYLSRFYFNSLFPLPGEGPDPSIDRTVSLLSEVDPGMVTNPVLDGKLAMEPSNDDIWSFPPFDRRAPADAPLLQVLFDAVKERRNDLIAQQSDDTAWKNFMEQYTEVHIFLRRKFFFERTDKEWMDMLPYRTYQQFYTLMTEPTSDLLQRTREDLVLAITASEVLDAGHIGNGDLVLRTSQDRYATVKGFRRFDQAKFSCTIADPGDMRRLLEHLPSTLLLSYESGVSLEVDLDLFEMLHRVMDGFRPSTNELQGSYVNLLIFKRQLANEPYREIVLRSDDGIYHRIYKTAPGRLQMERL